MSDGILAIAIIIAIVGSAYIIDKDMNYRLDDIANSVAAISKQVRHSDNAY